MSAAEPVDHTPTPPAAVNTGPGAAVIHINERRKPAGGWRTVTEPTPPGPDGDQLRRAYAGEVEEAFNAVGHTLTDQDTAEVFLRTLDIVAHALKGAGAQHIVTDEQLRKLAELVEDMRSLPRLV
jgi:hypothetical protein